MCYRNDLILVILPAFSTYEARTERSETSAYNIQMQLNYPKERIQHSENAKV